MDILVYKKDLEDKLENLDQESKEKFEYMYKSEMLPSVKLFLMLLFFFPLTYFNDEIYKTNTHKVLSIIQFISIILLVVFASLGILFLSGGLIIFAFFILFFYALYIMTINIYIIMNASKIKERTDINLKIEILDKIQRGVV